MSSDRVRSWCFTKNNYSESDEDIIYDLAFKCRYIVCGKEVGESGTPHFQGFLYFDNKVRFSTLKEYLPDGSHIEVMRGTHSEAINYCKKGEQSHEEWKSLGIDGPNFGFNADFFESGEKPGDCTDGGAKEKIRWDMVMANAMEGNWKGIPVDVMIRNGRGIQYAVHKLMTRNLTDTTEQMLWYWGNTGTGKSRKARDDYPDAYLKMCNKWWDDYTAQDAVIMEDFDVEHAVLGHHLKIWGDRYSFPAETKGGKIDIRPRIIIVTSNYHPNMIWRTEQALGPILRRFNCVEFKQLN